MFTPSHTCVRQERHWIVAEVCFNWINSMLPISPTASLDSTLKTIVPFDKSLRIDFVHDPTFNFFNFSLISFIFASFCKIASRDTPSTRSLLVQVWSSVVLPLTSLITVLSCASFLVLVMSSHIDCCCCDFQFVTFGAGRGVESLSNNSISVLRNNSVDAICWHKTVYNDCACLRVPELQSLFLCSGQFYPANGILISLPMTVVRFSRNGVIILSCVRKTVCRPLSPNVHPESIHSPG